MNKPKRHHFLPQFLLKGFASRTKGSESYAYRFGRGVTPFETNILNLAVVRKFHEGSHGDVEKQLSSRETRYAAAVEHLRKSVTKEEDIALLAEFVFNLMLRTKNLRDSFTVLGNHMLSMLDAPRVKRVIRKRVLNDLAKLPEVRSSLQRLPKQRRERVLSVLLTKSGIDVGTYYEKFWADVKRRVNMDEIIKNAQLKNLAAEGLPDARKKTFLAYHWYIDSKPCGSYVLGDVGPIAKSSDSTQLTLPYGFGDPTFVCLPVASDELLVGGDNTDREKLEPEEINLASVELSREFFISNRNTEREMKYSECIGLRAELVKHPEIARGLEEAIDEFERGE